MIQVNQEGDGKLVSSMTCNTNSDFGNRKDLGEAYLSVGQESAEEQQLGSLEPRRDC